VAAPTRTCTSPTASRRSAATSRSRRGGAADESIVYFAETAASWPYDSLTVAMTTTMYYRATGLTVGAEHGVSTA